MAELTTQDAAHSLNVTVRRFHYLVGRHQITPALEAPGKRGAKFWHSRDIEWLRRELDKRQAS